MNVGELKKALEKYPDDMEVIQCRYSDYSPLTEADFWTVWAVDQGSANGGYIMRSHHTMSEENKMKEKEYLYFEGN